ncbi:MAG: hypothetical protein HY254_02940 [Burkholderiales bacterium]|nr:hypothetical protein [Burkholderiales bacterium]
MAVLYFGDTNNPTHHSTSYFPARIIGGMVIERGPGNAGWGRQHLAVPSICFPKNCRMISIYVDNGFSLYANASLNRAKAKDMGMQVAKAQESDSAFGIQYKENGSYDSLIAKTTGSQYAKDSEPSCVQQRQTRFLAGSLRVPRGRSLPYTVTLAPSLSWGGIAQYLLRWTRRVIRRYARNLQESS